MNVKSWITPAPMRPPIVHVNGSITAGTPSGSILDTRLWSWPIASTPIAPKMAGPIIAIIVPTTGIPLIGFEIMRALDVRRPPRRPFALRALPPFPACRAKRPLAIRFILR